MIQKLNNQIVSAKNSGFDINNISDGYHSFEELYEHRYLLFLNVAKSHVDFAWKFKRNADGEKWEGWFGLGIFTGHGEQISYHLPMKYWDSIDCKSFDINPHYDGHTSNDVLTRLEKLLTRNDGN